MTDIKARIQTLASHPEADTYRLLWGSTHAFEALPTLSRANLIRTPFAQRCFSAAPGQTKIIEEGSLEFLLPRTYADIDSEDFGPLPNRPLVLFRNGHEGVEKSIWCYRKGALPLLAERNPEIAALQAQSYNTDGLIADAESFIAFMPYIQHAGISPHITIIDSSFTADLMEALRSVALEATLVLALPETGSITTAAVTSSITFTPSIGCIVEQREHIVVTKPDLEAFPLVRYDTGISPDTFRFALQGVS
jgi:hypothetical protein